MCTRNSPRGRLSGSPGWRPVVVPISLAREVSKLLAARSGQAIIVESAAGGGGLVAVSRVLGKPADGQTLLFMSNSLIAAQASRTRPDVDLRVILSDSEARQRYAARGFNPIWMSPGDAQQKVIDELAQMNKTIDALHIARQ